MAAHLHATLLLVVSCSLVRPEGTGYVEYYPGTLNILLSAPHGGSMVTKEIPDRVRGCYVNGACVWSHNCGATEDKSKCKATTVIDTNTLKLAVEIRDELNKLTGEFPHLVLSKLKRTKMDPNRDKPQAAFGHPLAGRVWDEYHGFMEAVRSNMTRGVVFDIHGHGRPEQWAMLGYLLSGSALQRGDFTPNQTSIKALVEEEGVARFDEILRGAGSFGAFLEARQFNAVPSPDNPHPGGKYIFKGGFITQRYGSLGGGTVDAIQIESPYAFRTKRFTEYSRATAAAILRFYSLYYDKREFRSVNQTDLDPNGGATRAIPHSWAALTAITLPVCAVHVTRTLWWSH